MDISQYYQGYTYIHVPYLFYGLYLPLQPIMSMLQVSKDEDAERVVGLLKDTVSLICKSSLKYNTELSVEGCIGITLDKTHMFLVNLKELIRNDYIPSQDLTSSKREADSAQNPEVLSSGEDSTDSMSPRSKKRRKRKQESKSNDDTFVLDCVSIPDSADNKQTEMTLTDITSPGRNRKGAAADDTSANKTELIDPFSLPDIPEFELVPVKQESDLVDDVIQMPPVPVNIIPNTLFQGSSAPSEHFQASTTSSEHFQGSSIARQQYMMPAAQGGPNQPPMPIHINMPSATTSRPNTGINQVG